MVRSPKANFPRGGRRTVFQPPPLTPDTRATRDPAVRHRHRLPVALDAAPQEHTATGPARGARRGRGASRAGVASSVSLFDRADLRLVTFVPCACSFKSLAERPHHIAHGHISTSPRCIACRGPIIRSSQLSVSRTTCAHNRTRARSPPRSETPHTTPPLLSIHALHSASGAHTRQRPHRARTLHARTPHWRPLPFCTHACTCHLERARSSPRRERGTPARGASSVRRTPLSRDHGSITQAHCQQPQRKREVLRACAYATPEPPHPLNCLKRDTARVPTWRLPPPYARRSCRPSWRGSQRRAGRLSSSPPWRT